MSLNLAQAIVHNTIGWDQTGAPAQIVSATFGAATTAGNTIVVIITASCQVSPANIGVNSITDTQGNIYTRLYYSGDAHYIGPPMIGIYVCDNIVGGADTISFSANWTAGVSFHHYVTGLAIIELTGASSTSLNSSGSILGATGVHSITINDSHSVAITSDAGGSSPFAGYQAGFVVADLLTAGADLFLGITVNGTLTLNPPAVSPSVWTYTQVDTYSNSYGYASQLVYIFTRTLPIVTNPCPISQRGNIDYDQIGIDARHGNGQQIQMFDTSVPSVTGNIPVFTACKNIKDSGVSISSIGGTLAVTSITALRAMSAPASITAISVEGYYTAGDGGGGLFIWDTASTASDDSGTIILPTGYAGSGRWRRLYTGAVSVRWFGAKGDGSTNDSTSITSAITVAAANWGKVVFDAAVYICTNIQISSNKIALFGQTGTVLRNNNSASSILVINSNQCTVEDIEFDGNKSSVGGVNANVLILGNYNHISRCRSYNSTNQGICLDGQSTSCYDNTIDNCEIYNNNGIGISNNKSTDVIISNCFVYTNSLEGVTADNSSTHASIIGCRIDNNCTSSGVGGIGVDNSDDVRIIGNTITNTHSLSGIKTQNNLGALNRLIIQSNSITSNGGPGVWLHNGTGGASNYCVIDGNTFISNTTAPIVVDSSCTNNMIGVNNLGGGIISDSGSGTIIIQTAGGGGGGGTLFGINKVTTSQSTSSTSYVDLTTQDTTTFTLSASSKVIVKFSSSMTISLTHSGFDTINIDGTNISDGGLSTSSADWGSQSITTGFFVNSSWSYLTTTLASGSHTIKIMHRTDGATVTWANRTLEVWGSI